MSQNISCYLCRCPNYFVKAGSVRNNGSLQVYECIDCGLVFLSSFDHIRNGFYENSGMHDGQIDKEAWMKETAWDDDRRFMSLRRVIENKKILDFGCGNGGFLLKAREVAKHVEGIELESNLKDWFLENRLDIFSRIEDSSGSFDVITIFHVLEHLPDPRTSLVEISAKLDNDGQLVVEVPNACDALISLYQNEPFMRFTYWSCHLYLFNQATLTTLAKQAGLRVNYVRQVQRYSLSNHLHWLAKGTPGGHMKWSFLDSPELHSSYEKQLAAIGACDTIVASLSRT